MKNEDAWKPTKFVMKRGEWVASRDPATVAPCSRHFVDLIGRAFTELLPRYAKGAFLDLGCGSVPLYGLYRSHVDSITCMDWGNSRHGLGHLDLECDLNVALPIAEASYDTVLLSDVLEHIAEPSLLMAEVSRILRPGGHLLITVPFLYWIHESPHDYHRYTAFALDRLCRRNGLEPLLITPLGGSLDVLADIVAKHLYSIPLVGGLLSSIPQTLAALGALVPGGLRLRNRTARAFPIGYIVVARRTGKLD